MDTTMSVNTSARDFTGKLVVSLIQQTLQKTPEATAPAVNSASGKGTTIDLQV